MKINTETYEISYNCIKCGTEWGICGDDYLEDGDGITIEHSQVCLFCDDSLLEVLKELWNRDRESSLKEKLSECLVYSWNRIISSMLKKNYY